MSANLIKPVDHDSDPRIRRNLWGNEKIERYEEMSRGIVDRIIDSIIDDDLKGSYGEWLTKNELKWVKFFGRSGKTVQNIYIPKEKGETTEIDLVYITRKGIFVFESKNYSGWIFGNEKDLYWTVSLPNGAKHRFYNPIKQNRTHIKWLSAFIGKGVPMFSVIVFSERCELKKILTESPDVKVIKRERTYAAVRDIWDVSPDALNEEEISAVYNKLMALTNVDASFKAAHINNIEQKYKQKTECLNCPRCGGKLVLRTAKKGENAGNQFYGCSNFPECRYIKNISSDDHL